ncbi:MAG: cupin domain-containing protein [Candidatus Scalindua sp.]|nr:cupin domain-containing protein [Candidatus Scalindua sp.]
MNHKNIFADIPKQIPDEVLEEIMKTEHFRIERIISHGHSTDQDEWYDQDQDEWVIVLKGSAGLLFEGNDTAVIMSPGDYVNIPAHQKHRVEWTEPDAETVWLAIHY